MRMILFPLLGFAVISAHCADSAADSSVSKNAAVFGLYNWTVPGSTTDLVLKASGEYLLFVVANSAGPTSVGYRESGRWIWSGFALVLTPAPEDVSHSFDQCRRLFPLQTATGKELLVSAPRAVGLEGDTNFEVLFVKVPNQSPQPAVASGPRG